ncbi:zinc finger protein 677-like [Teleopsis dalmanni]|uniref:zinc finger protein 677-like n=1 Tax=Teleopsis dalmanni TaxID=139649 RepID=UPI0018CD9F05|nr:zinc finger protein 677-like [Teleopsis dalmanni]XP_037934664.1 zinc finger protein 677-like [Teleopsis dalmanni]XP_037934665.1 zinc finger protein 677-like [Teleopsis dalmanni]
MSTLAYPPEEEIFKFCRKKCGVITTTEDQQYFALGCLLCTEKFLYFDAFIGHMQIEHPAQEQGIFGGTYNEMQNDIMSGIGNGNGKDEDFNDTDPTLLEPQMVMVKEEILEEPDEDDAPLITGFSAENEAADVAISFLSKIKAELPDADISLEEIDQHKLLNESFNSFDDYGVEDDYIQDQEPDVSNIDDDEDEDDPNYDNQVEESLLSDKGLTLHIKDRKMIQFVIDSYRRNSFLWDHRHPQFRDRVKRQKFLEWIAAEFKRRFNISLAKDAVTRKWDNLRTVYKRECNRMSIENTNISTLWYFKELHFLNRIYGGNQKMSEAVIQETVYRRRYSALWNDVSTAKLLAMVKEFPCFYNKYNCDYRSKEKRGEALQQMAAELQQMIDVTTIQISKRISQLRFDYSKQKYERLTCEQGNKVFVPSYTYYYQMNFMDDDIAPFKCDHCPQILQTSREFEEHLTTHQITTNSAYVCRICSMSFTDVEQYHQHKRVHLPQQMKEVKFQCDLCTASFREKSNYDEHMRRHNDELFLPSLVNTSNDGNVFDTEKPFICDVCGKGFANANYLNSHRVLHAVNRLYPCDYPQCTKAFSSRQTLVEHTRSHYSAEMYNCDTCGKGFKSVKNLHNHKQIHDAVKKYICKICGSAFAQAAGLYLHKRRHNRPNSRIRSGFL